MDTPYIELFAGSQQVATTLVHFAADAGVIQEFTPLMLADNGEFKPWDGQESGKAVYLTAYPVDTSTQKSAQCYKTGIFNIAAVNWPESVDTDAKNVPPLRVLVYLFSRWRDKQGERWHKSNQVSWRYRWRVNLKLKRGQWLTDVYQPTKLYINLTNWKRTGQAAR